MVLHSFTDLQSKGSGKGREGCKKQWLDVGESVQNVGASQFVMKNMKRMARRTPGSSRQKFHGSLETQ